MRSRYVSTSSDAATEQIIDGISDQEDETFMEIGIDTVYPGMGVQTSQFQMMMLFVLGIIIGILLIGRRFKS